MAWPKDKSRRIGLIDLSFHQRILQRYSRPLAHPWNLLKTSLVHRFMKFLKPVSMHNSLMKTGFTHGDSHRLSDNSTSVGEFNRRVSRSIVPTKNQSDQMSPRSAIVQANYTPGRSISRTFKEAQDQQVFQRRSPKTLRDSSVIEISRKNASPAMNSFSSASSTTKPAEPFGAKPPSIDMERGHTLRPDTKQVTTIRHYSEITLQRAETTPNEVAPVVAENKLPRLRNFQAKRERVVRDESSQTTINRPSSPRQEIEALSETMPATRKAYTAIPTRASFSLPIFMRTRVNQPNWVRRVDSRRFEKNEVESEQQLRRQESQEGLGLTILRKALSPADYTSKQVEVHTDAQSNQLANAFGAEAFTVGRHIFFASQKFDLTTPKGIALFGHELTHVRQQEERPGLFRSEGISPAQYNPLEEEALANERTALSELIHPSLPFEGRRDHGPEIARVPQGSVMMKTLPAGEAIQMTHFSLLPLPVSQGTRIPSPMMAANDRDLGNPATSAIPATAPVSVSGVNIRELADQVYRMITMRLEVERERTGI